MPRDTGFLIQHHNHILAMFHGCFNRARKPLLRSGFHRDLIHNDLDIVNLVPVELHAQGYLADFPIDPHIQKALFSDLFE